MDDSGHYSVLQQGLSKAYFDMPVSLAGRHCP